jgi:Na+-transporting methylmalonyl-CoA/oxaloacetate decarboxylase gamma subunit
LPYRSIGRSLVYFVLFLLMTICRFIGNLMSDNEDERATLLAAQAEQMKMAAAAQAARHGAFATPTTPTLLR